MSFRDRLMNSVPFIGSKSAPPTKYVGGPETIIIGGYVGSNEKNPKLVGRQKFATFNQNLANIAIVAAGTRHFLNMLAKAKWTVEPPGDATPEQEEKAELVKEMMRDMDVPWHRVVRRQGMYKFHGFAIQEWIAKRRDDGFIGMKTVEQRPQSTITRWDRDKHGIVQGIIQTIPQDGTEVYLPLKKVIYSVDDTLTDSPEGQGSFRSVVESIDRLKEYHDLELLGYQTDLRGIPIGRAPVSETAAAEEAGSVPKGTTDKMMKSLRDLIKNHMRNRTTGIVLDSSPYFSKGETGTVGGSSAMWGLELLTSASSSTGEIAKAIQRLVREIAIALGCDHLLTGSDGSGSLALSKDKTDNFLLNVNSVLQDLAEDFEKQWLGRIWTLNGWDSELKPKLKVEEISNRSADVLAGILRDISTAGVDIQGHDELVKEFFNMIGLTPPERDEADWTDPALALGAAIDIDPLTGEPKEPDEPKPGDVKEKPEDKKKELGLKPGNKLKPEEKK